MVYSQPSAGAVLRQDRSGCGVWKAREVSCLAKRAAFVCAGEAAQTMGVGEAWA